MLPAPTAESLVKSVDPPFAFSAQLSADGRYVHILPRGFLRPDTDYVVKLAGEYAGAGGGSFSDRIEFETERRAGEGPPLQRGRKRVGAFNLRRLSLPLPPLLPSVNQIGFDSYDWVVGALESERPDDRSRGELLMWVVGSREEGNGRRVPDRRSEFAFPLSGRYSGDSLILEQRGFELLFTFGPLPLERLQFRGRLDANRRIAPGASVYGEVNCPDVPNLGGALIAAGLCNEEAKLVSSGAYLTSGYRGPANRRPGGVAIDSVELRRPTAAEDGVVAAKLDLERGAHFGVNRHTANLLLVDSASGEPLGLDHNGLTTLRRRGRKITGIDLRLPAGTGIPGRLDAYVIADVYPLGKGELG
jgi:hypothetical protein